MLKNEAQAACENIDILSILAKVDASINVCTKYMSLVTTIAFQKMKDWLDVEFWRNKENDLRDARELLVQYYYKIFSNDTTGCAEEIP